MKVPFADDDTRVALPELSFEGDGAFGFGAQAFGKRDEGSVRPGIQDKDRTRHRGDHTGCASPRPRA